MCHLILGPQISLYLQTSHSVQASKLLVMICPGSLTFHLLSLDYSSVLFSYGFLPRLHCLLPLYPYQSSRADLLY